jgi:hypothetical protein
MEAILTLQETRSINTHPSVTDTHKHGHVIQTFGYDADNNNNNNNKEIYARCRKLKDLHEYRPLINKTRLIILPQNSII